MNKLRELFSSATITLPLALQSAAVIGISIQTQPAAAAQALAPTTAPLTSRIAALETGSHSAATRAANTPAASSLAAATPSTSFPNTAHPANLVPDNSAAETSATSVAADNASSSLTAGATKPNIITADVSAVHRKFSLSACFDRAAADNKEILIAAAALPVARAAITIAKAIPNPSFNVTYGFGPAWQYIVAGNNQQFGWTEEILVAGRRTKRVNLAAANYWQSAFRLEAVRFDVHNRVRRSYAELVAATAYADLIETQREIAKNLLVVAKKRFEAGKAAGAEVLQASLNEMQFETQRNQALGRLIQDSTTLAQLLGEVPQFQEIIDVDENALFKLSSGKSILVPDPARGNPPLIQLLPAAWRERNDLKAAIQQAYADRKSVTLAKTQRIPDPYIGFNYLFSTYKQFQTQYFSPDGTQNHSPANKVPYQPGYVVTFAQESPIFYQYQGQIKQAKATLQQQLKQNEVTQASIANDIVAAYEALEVTRKNILKFQDELLPAGLKVAQMGRRSYELGKTDLATAILAQQQYQQLRSSYFDSIVAYQNAWADLEKAIGVPLNPL